MVITYTLRLEVSRAVPDSDEIGTSAEHAEAMRGAPALRELEREVLRCLRRLDGDCDTEVMETKQTED